MGQFSDQNDDGGPIKYAKSQIKSNITLCRALCIIICIADANILAGTESIAPAVITNTNIVQDCYFIPSFSYFDNRHNTRAAKLH